MSELAHAPRGHNQIHDPLTSDVLQFVTIIENVQSERQNGIGNRAHPALNAAFGMLAAWNTLAAPEETSSMPALRSRVAEYLAGQNLPMKTVSHWKAPLSKLAYLAPEILDELYASLPERYENPRLLESVEGLSVHKARSSARSKAGKLILGGLQHALGPKG